MGKYDINAHVLGTCVKYCTNASLLGADGTYGWSPNITGTVGRVVGSGYASGAFSDTTQANSVQSGTSAPLFRNQFDASLSNSIYTNSGKVYPASVALNYIIKA